MWKALIQASGTPVELHDPLSGADLSVAENILRIVLPDELKSLLSESDGIFGEYEAGIIWPLERIIEYNLDAWNDSYYKLQHPLRSLLFFADAGNGDWFGFSVVSGQVVASDIFVWDHEKSSIRVIAHSLQDYLRRWLTGDLKV